MGKKEREIKKFFAGKCYPWRRGAPSEKRGFIGWTIRNIKYLENYDNVRLILSGISVWYYRKSWHWIWRGKKGVALYGKKCKLEYFPGSEVIIRNEWTNSQILILEKDTCELHLKIYMLNELAASLFCANALRVFCKYLPKGISLVESELRV